MSVANYYTREIPMAPSHLPVIWEPESEKQPFFHRGDRRLGMELRRRIRGEPPEDTEPDA